MRDWNSVHVHYHDDPAGLLLDGVRPLFEETEKEGVPAYFQRHWKLGPHLRLHFAAPPEKFAAVVGPAAERIVGGHLARHPSTAALDPAAHEEEHRNLGRLEQEPGPFLPWQPDNTVVHAPYDRRLQVHGTVEASEQMADFLCATTASAFEMLAAVRDGRHLTSLAFDVMVASAQRLDDSGLRTGFVSFRSHAEAFLSTWAEGEGLRPAWDAHYRAHRSSLTARVTALVERLEGGSAPQLLTNWLAAADGWAERATALVRAGKLSIGPPPEGRQEYERVLWTYLERSEFHRRTMGDREASREVEQQDWFVRRRMVFNQTYLQLTRVGLTPAQRFLLCHLLANAVEDVYGTSALDVALAEPEERRRAAERRNGAPEAPPSTRPARAPASGGALRTGDPETAPLPVTERVRLRHGVRSLTGPDGATHLVRWPYTLRLGTLGRPAEALLWRLAADEVAAEEVAADEVAAGEIAVAQGEAAEAGAEKGPAGPRDEESRRMLEDLRSRGWLVVSVYCAGEHVWTAAPTGPPRPDPAPPAPLLRRPELSKFAAVESSGDGLRLSSPQARTELRLGNGFLLEVVDALARRRPLPDGAGRGALTRRALEELAAGGFLAESGEEEAAIDTARWSPHELRFHQLSRQPLGVGTDDQLLRVGPGDWFPGTPAPPARPEPFDGPVVALPEPPPSGGATEAATGGGLTLDRALRERRSVRRQAPLALDELGEFLRRSAGVQHRPDGPEGRPYPSGGAAYELEVYPVVGRLPGLDPGMYHYDAHGHRLQTVAPHGRATAAMLRRAGRAMGAGEPPPLLLVVSARFGRVMTSYQALAYGMTLKHVGALFQTMYLVATDMGLAPCAVEAADYDGFAEATGRSRLQESCVGEFVLGRPAEQARPRR